MRGRRTRPARGGRAGGAWCRGGVELGVVGAHGDGALHHVDALDGEAAAGGADSGVEEGTGVFGFAAEDEGEDVPRVVVLVLFDQLCALGEVLVGRALRWEAGGVAGVGVAN